ncbi:MAG: PEP/pyruvate-binding domain-containing protein [Verrucomicrobiia bacterium]|jgi:hypothetical protein
MNYIFQLVLTLGLFVLTADSPAQRPSRGPGGGGTGKRVMPEDLKFEDGVATIPDRAAFEKISYQGSDVKRDRYLAGVEFVKFIVDEPGSEKPILYFMNTKNHRAHPPYMGMVGIQDHGIPRGALTYLPRLKAPNGEAGLYTIDFQPYDSYSCEQIQTILTILTAKMPILKGRVAFHPLSGNLDLYEREKGKYVAAGIAVHLDSDLYRNIAYLPLNEAESFGLLRVMKNDGRPSPRDIVIYQTLPNQMPRVAGVITEVRQTPLSHVNLRAVQDKIPNAYIDSALKSDRIKPFLGKLVNLKVTAQGFKLREATKAEVDQHFADLRPAKNQKPVRDLRETKILPLKELKFESSSSYGVKAANLATLQSLPFPKGTVPAGFAVPFHFYHEFMRHNGLYLKVDELLGAPAFLNDREVLDSKLNQLRKQITSGDMPVGLAAELGEIQNRFAKGVSIRCRTSTNNEDLPGFSGAGLYDSFTHKPDEGHLTKSIKQVFASLWNFRAFEEREFYRIDHKLAAMGVVLHPNQKGELANGVAVSDDILYETKGNYYLNTQVGEDLVTNPDKLSSPEEILLGWWERDGHQFVRRSAAVADGKQVLSDKHLAELRNHLGRIHSRFGKLYRIGQDEPFAMEIEFKIKKDGKLQIKQARPWVF